MYVWLLCLVSIFVLVWSCVSLLVRYVNIFLKQTYWAFHVPIGVGVVFTIFFFSIFNLLYSTACIYMCVCVSKSKFYCVYLPSFFILSVSCVFCFNFFPDFVFIIFVISNISYVICCCFVAMNLFFFSLFFYYQSLHQQNWLYAVVVFIYYCGYECIAEKKNWTKQN